MPSHTNISSVCRASRLSFGDNSWFQFILLAASPTHFYLCCSCWKIVLMFCQLFVVSFLHVVKTNNDVLCCFPASLTWHVGACCVKLNIWHQVEFAVILKHFHHIIITDMINFSEYPVQAFLRFYECWSFWGSGCWWSQMRAKNPSKM